jgi:hypothetical protein
MSDAFIDTEADICRVVNRDSSGLVTRTCETLSGLLTNLSYWQRY